MREAIMRLRKRKQEVKKDLHDALLERNCMLHFMHYLDKRDERSLAYFNFWLEAQLYHTDDSSNEESCRICNDYLPHLKLSPLATTLLNEEKVTATPYLFLIAQGEVWTKLSKELFPEFQATKGIPLKISSAKSKRVCSSQATTVALIDKYLNLRTKEDLSDNEGLNSKAAKYISAMKMAPWKSDGMKNASSTPAFVPAPGTPGPAAPSVFPATRQQEPKDTFDNSKSSKMRKKYDSSVTSSSSSKRKNDSRNDTDKNSVSSSVETDNTTPPVPTVITPHELAKKLTTYFSDPSVARLHQLHLPSFPSFWLDLGLYFAFRDYLTSVYSEDSLAFYIKAEHYRLVLDEKQRFLAVRQLFSYIERNIIHATSRQCQKIRAQFSTAPSNVFLEVSNQIYDLLRFQWIDFVFSPYFQQCRDGTYDFERCTILNKNKLSITLKCFLDLREYHIKQIGGNMLIDIRSRGDHSVTARHSVTSISSSTAFTSTFSVSSSPLKSSSQRHSRRKGKSSDEIDEEGREASSRRAHKEKHKEKEKEGSSKRTHTQRNSATPKLQHPKASQQKIKTLSPHLHNEDQYSRALSSRSKGSPHLQSSDSLATHKLRDSSCSGSYSSPLHIHIRSCRNTETERSDVLQEESSEQCLRAQSARQGLLLLSEETNFYGKDPKGKDVKITFVERYSNDSTENSNSDTCTKDVQS
eukprot:TRINITY_DN3839_c0_g1_i1.p1 TRINITY_DN3839_c0_g1~~TRINITY_DN3839_c0_g1_i1.p1  ORF type:complete len:694 (-),score=95.01 TRINITY_DN3839_c0_g1_i1:116-2197(-)